MVFSEYRFLLFGTMRLDWPGRRLGQLKALQG
jgi:hypothetical protein